MIDTRHGATLYRQLANIVVCQTSVHQPTSHHMKLLRVVVMHLNLCESIYLEIILSDEVIILTYQASNLIDCLKCRS
jgi:hypothetical protein